MKGVINQGLQELIEEQHGSRVWEEIKQIARCDEPFFVIAEDYPDEMTFALIRAASKRSGLSVDDLMVEFGKHWVVNTGPISYPTFFQFAGSSARSFLRNMDRIHDQVTHQTPGATPPHFEYTDTDDGRLLLHYHSARGMCSVVRGLILGVGLHFGEPLTVVESKCAKRGADHCTMEIGFS